MSSFLDDLTITQLVPFPRRANETPAERRKRRKSWRLFRLAHDLRFDLGGGAVVCVPAGFISDGPSIPRVFWHVLPVFGIWSRAGFLHDFLCCLIAMERPHECAPTRQAADRVFLRAMVDLDVDWLQFSILYLGVTVGRWLDVRTDMVDFNDKLAAILDLQQHPHSLAALATEGAVPRDNAAADCFVAVAKEQARARA